MANPYNVFAMNKNGAYLWIGEADSMLNSWKLIAARKPLPEDKYMIYDQTTGNIIEILAGEGLRRHSPTM